MFGQQKEWRSAVAARRRLASVFVLSFSILLLMLFLAPPASATGCVFASGTVTVTINSPATALIGVNVVAGVDQIVFDNDNTLAGAGQCGTATVANTNLIDVNGSSGGEAFFIDFSDGPFASNNDFNIDLLTGSDRLTVVGSGGADTISVSLATDINVVGGRATNT